MTSKEYYSWIEGVISKAIEDVKAMSEEQLEAELTAFEREVGLKPGCSKDDLTALVVAGHRTFVGKRRK